MKLGTIERIALRKAVRAHPDVRKHVSKSADVNTLPKEELVALASTLGIDIEVAVRRDGGDPLADSGLMLEGQELADYSHKYPAFVGELPFDLVLELFGNRVVRQARVEYSFTPPWEYFDLHKGEVMLGWESSVISIEVRSEPTREYYDYSPSGRFRKQKPKPAWQRVDLLEDGILPEEVMDDIYSRIEQEALKEDAKRRARHAAAKPA